VRKVKSLSDKWEKLKSTYSKIKKLCNQISGDARDEDIKFIWYDKIDEILSFATKINRILKGMNKEYLVSKMRTSIAPINLNKKNNGESQASLL